MPQSPPTLTRESSGEGWQEYTPAGAPTSAEELHFAAAASTTTSSRKDNHGFDIPDNSNAAPAPEPAPGLVKTFVQNLVGAVLPSKSSAEKGKKDSDLPTTFAECLALLKTEQAALRALEKTPSTPKVQALRETQSIRVDRIRKHLHFIENSCVVAPPVTDPFRRKIVAQTAAHPDVQDILKPANEAATNHRRMMAAYEYDLDPKDGARRIGLMLTSAAPLDPKVREVIVQKLRDLSIPAIASLMRDEARSNCQMTLETLTPFIVPLLEAAIPVARQIAEDVRADEARHDAGYGLPHQPRQAFATALEFVAQLEDQLRSITASQRRTTLSMSADPFTYSLSLLNPAA